jgi:hypothetical protein
MLFNFFKTTISVKNYIVVGIGARKHKNKLGLLMEVQEESAQQMGASMIKWTKRMLRYTKTIDFWVKGLKVVTL